MCGSGWLPAPCRRWALERGAGRLPFHRARPRTRTDSLRASSASPRTCSGDMYAIVPDHLSRRGQRCECGLRDWNRRCTGWRRADVCLARPKSRSFAWPRSVMKMLPGLMSRWTRPLPCAASSASAICSPTSTAMSVGKRLPVDLVVERRAFQQLHHDEMAARVLADVVDGADVRMVQPRRRTRFALEPVDCSPIARQFVRQEFQSHRSPQPGVLCFVDLSHAAASKFVRDAVVGDCLADHRGFVTRVGLTILSVSPVPAGVRRFARAGCAGIITRCDLLFLLFCF